MPRSGHGGFNVFDYHRNYDNSYFLLTLEKSSQLVVEVPVLVLVVVPVVVVLVVEVVVVVLVVVVVVVVVVEYALRTTTRTVFRQVLPSCVATVP
jgi:hypothetical protein